MNAVKTGIVLKVKNLAKCRAFYRDILDLGNPIVDSNFRAVFVLGYNVELTLETIDSEEKLPKNEGRLVLSASFVDPDEIIARLEAHGYQGRDRSHPVSSSRILEFHDPEGNPFQLQYY